MGGDGVWGNQGELCILLQLNPGPSHDGASGGSLDISQHMVGIV